MYRLIIFLFAALLFAPAPAQAQDGTAQVRLLERFSLTSVQDLDFGRLTLDGSAGTVSINADTSARTTTGGVTVAGGTPRRGDFVGVGQPGGIVTINRQDFPVLTRVGGTETLTAQPLYPDSSWRRFTVLGTTYTYKFIGLDGIVTLGVGADLAIPAGTVPGIYTGQYTLTINYF
ncbi:MAG: DUF4402 domain-containing protein [Pacificimonas sp.]